MASYDTPVSPAGILIDLDGTVFRGNELIEGAREAIKTLRRMGKKIVFLSNRGISPVPCAEKKLLGAGIETDVNDIVLSSSVTAAFLKLSFFKGMGAWGARLG